MDSVVEIGRLLMLKLVKSPPHLFAIDMWEHAAGHLKSFNNGAYVKMPGKVFKHAGPHDTSEAILITMQ